MGLYKRTDKKETSGVEDSDTDTDDMRCHESFETDYVKSAINKWQLSPVLTLLQQQTPVGASARTPVGALARTPVGALARTPVGALARTPARPRKMIVQALAGIEATMGESFFEDLSKKDLAKEPDAYMDSNFFFEFGASLQMAKVYTFFCL
jgi:hypothetical protein